RLPTSRRPWPRSCGSTPPPTAWWSSTWPTARWRRVLASSAATASSASMTNASPGRATSIAPPVGRTACGASPSTAAARSCRWCSAARSWPRSPVAAAAVAQRPHDPHPQSPISSLGDQPLADDRGGGRRIPDRDDDAGPTARVVAAVVGLGHVGGDVALQNHRPEVVADQPADRELALLAIVRDRPIQVGRAEGDETELPFAELLGRRQVDVQEVGVAAIEPERHRTRRYLRLGRDVIELDAPDHVRRQVPAIGRIAEGKALVERGGVPGQLAAGFD